MQQRSPAERVRCRTELPVRIAEQRVDLANDDVDHAHREFLLVGDVPQDHSSSRRACASRVSQFPSQSASSTAARSTRSAWSGVMKPHQLASGPDHSSRFPLDKLTVHLCWRKSVQCTPGKAANESRGVKSDGLESKDSRRSGAAVYSRDCRQSAGYGHADWSYRISENMMTRVPGGGLLELIAAGTSAGDRHLPYQS